MPDWIVYFDDGSSATSDEAAPHEVRRDGVQVIAAKDIGTGRLLWHSSDFYCWQDREWVPRSLLGLMDYLREPGPEKIVLQGKGIAYAKFTAIYMNAVHDPRLPPKSAGDPREHPGPTI